MLSTMSPNRITDARELFSFDSDLMEGKRSNCTIDDIDPLPRRLIYCSHASSNERKEFNRISVMRTFLTCEESFDNAKLVPWCNGRDRSETFAESNISCGQKGQHKRQLSIMLPLDFSCWRFMERKKIYIHKSPRSVRSGESFAGTFESHFYWMLNWNFACSAVGSICDAACKLERLLASLTIDKTNARVDLCWRSGEKAFTGSSRCQKRCCWDGARSLLTNSRLLRKIYLRFVVRRFPPKLPTSKCCHGAAPSCFIFVIGLIK